MADDVLEAPLVLEYPFTRTTGPIVGRFLTGCVSAPSSA